MSPGALSVSRGRGGRREWSWRRSCPTGGGKEVGGTTFAPRSFGSALVRMSALLVLLAALLVVCQASPNPHSHGVVGAKKFADVDDCNGAIAFSSVGTPETAHGNKLPFLSALIDKGIGWSPENGEFTCHCPGLYQFSFAGSGDKDTRLSLKKQLSKEDTWSTVVATGPGGGSSVALLEMDVGDKTAIWLDAGKLHQETDKSPISAFSGFRIAKK